MNKIIPTILLTSVFWILIYILICPKNQTDTDTENTIDYSENIIGEWHPTEMSESNLIFSKYGTMRIGDSPIDCNYTIDKDIITISLFNIVDDSFRIKIYTEDNDTYLEIFDMPQFAGKYKKVKNTKKQKKSSNSATNTQKTSATATKPTNTENKSVKKSSNIETEQQSDILNIEVDDTPITIQEPEISKQTVDYYSAITGKWKPIEGAKNSLEFSKYGTVIQWIGGSVDMRYEYSLKGDKMDIGYDSNAKVKISDEGNNTYLEIYNSQKFSGKYILISKAPSVDATKINIDEYQEAIAGKWKPMFGAKEILEFSRYGTVIQWIGGSVDMRYEYSLNGNRLNIGYDDNAKAVISRNTNGTYLEIYNSNKFSGLYKKL